MNHYSGLNASRIGKIFQHKAKKVIHKKFAYPDFVDQILDKEVAEKCEKCHFTAVLSYRAPEVRKRALFIHSWEHLSSIYRKLRKLRTRLIFVN